MHWINIDTNKKEAKMSFGNIAVLMTLDLDSKSDKIFIVDKIRVFKKALGVIREEPFRKSFNMGLVFVCLKQDLNDNGYGSVCNKDIETSVLKTLVASDCHPEGYVTRNGEAYFNGELVDMSFNGYYEAEKKRYHIIRDTSMVDVIIENELTIV